MLLQSRYWSKTLAHPEAFPLFSNVYGSLVVDHSITSIIIYAGRGGWLILVDMGFNGPTSSEAA